MSSRSDQAGASKWPFLSAVLLLEHETLADIQDILVALDAQSNQDFELLVLAQHLDQNDERVLRSEIEPFSGGLAERTTFLVASAKSAPSFRRAVALNSAVELARGEYFAMLDLGTVPFAGWVEEFVVAAQRSPGMVLRTLGAEQHFATAPWPDRSLGFEPVDSPRITGPVHFSAVEQLVHPASPLAAFAIPTRGFAELGLVFDEHLEGEAELEVLLRAALALGVDDRSETVTSLSRRWTDGSEGWGESAAAREEVADAVAARFDPRPLTLPVGSASSIRALAAAAVRADRIEPSVARQGDDLNVTAPDGPAEVEQPEALRCELARLRGEVAAIRASRSWRLTSPLRRAQQLIATTRRARKG